MIIRNNKLTVIVILQLKKLCFLELHRERLSIDNSIIFKNIPFISNTSACLTTTSTK